MSKYYSDEFKKKIVELRKMGKPLKEIEEEYGVTRTSVRTWVTQEENSGKFTKKDNMSETEKELIKVKKELKQLRMENDILKQAALIMARKSE